MLYEVITDSERQTKIPNNGHKSEVTMQYSIVQYGIVLYHSPESPLPFASFNARFPFKLFPHFNRHPVKRASKINTARALIPPYCQ